MKKIHLIPDRENLRESLALKEKYHAAWEFNDFFLPEVLSDVRKQSNIIEEYAAVCSDFSEDTIHGAFFDITPHSADPLIRDAAERRMIESMEIAKEMGVRGVVFHSGRIYDFRDEAYLKNWQKANAAIFRKLLDKYPNQEIYMENMFDEAPDIMAAFGASMADEERFGICLDYAHAAVFGTEPEKWVAQLAPYVKHMHINDNDRKNDLHLCVGEGKLDWQQFSKQMMQYKINASVLIEVKGIEKQQKSLEYMADRHIWPL